jgi:hypothetical protein
MHVLQTGSLLRVEKQRSNGVLTARWRAAGERSSQGRRNAAAVLQLNLEGDMSKQSTGNCSKEAYGEASDHDADQRHQVSVNDLQER